eukprot:TRINITY_DN1081_c0_g1_i1.p1 TRINITY_DN1081_c0_g1~~TRINITY_DN1081_c0_g1_i1.p1  ORF type:complete len:608 (-),score=224.88 TRINITY_DN1081_c0_g1_i1:24-1847(-)
MSHIKKTFEDIGSMDEFWQWLQGPFQEAVTNDEWYNGDKFTAAEEGFLYNYNKLIGGIRIRQLRVRDDSCTPSDTFVKTYPKCWGYYSPEATEKAAFGPGNKFKYSDPANTNIPYEVGRTDSAYYDGGGYIVDFKKNSTALPSELTQLIADKYLDKKTRVVFVTINVMNGNLGLFMLCKFMIEFTPGGYTAPFSTFKAFKMEPYLNPIDLFRGVLELSTIVFLAFFLRQEIDEAIQTYKARGSVLYYFEDGWNYLDLLNLGLLWTVVIINSIFVFGPDRNNFDATTIEYINLEQVADMYYLVFSLQSISVLIVFLKIFKYLQMNAKMSLMWSTLGMASADLVAFFIFFMIVFLGFSMMGHLLFGATVEDYRELGLSLITCFKMILGEFNYTEIQRANRFLGAVFFILFILLVYFTLANMFLAIINDAYAIVNRKAQGTKLGAQLKKGIRKKLERFGQSALDKEKAISDKELLDLLVSKKSRIPEGTVLSTKELTDLLSLGGKNDVLERLVYIYNNMREKTGKTDEVTKNKGDGEDGGVDSITSSSSAAMGVGVAGGVTIAENATLGDESMAAIQEALAGSSKKLLKHIATIDVKLDAIRQTLAKNNE